MALPVVTVASGGLPVVDVTATTPKFATPITEAANGRGVAVTQVAARGMPVVYAYIGGDVAPFTPTAFNPADKIAGLTLTNNNLTATFAANTGVRAVKGLSSGKYYFEMTQVSWSASSYSLSGLILLATSLLSQAAGTVYVLKSGQTAINGSAVGSFLGSGASGTVIGYALDLTGGLVWTRFCPVGNWMGNASANPVTGVSGGQLVGVLAGAVLYPYTAQSTGSGDVVTANFGGSAFVGAVPSGYTAGWG
jgi:hypothetical protein